MRCNRCQKYCDSQYPDTVIRNGREIPVRVAVFAGFNHKALHTIKNGGVWFYDKIFAMKQAYLCPICWAWKMDLRNYGKQRGQAPLGGK